MRSPADPARFVSEAERITNERDLAGAVSVYGRDAVLETVTDGAYEHHVGVEAIRLAWAVYFAVLDRAAFVLRKQLLVADGHVVVNEWRGALARREAHGIECWHFDRSGWVTEHRLYSYFDVRPSESVIQRFRLLFAYPRLAMSFLREQRRWEKRLGRR
jgi:hypothetical protein